MLSLFLLSRTVLINCNISPVDPRGWPIHLVLVRKTTRPWHREAHQRTTGNFTNRRLTPCHNPSLKTSFWVHQHGGAYRNALNRNTEMRYRIGVLGE